MEAQINLTLITVASILGLNLTSLIVLTINHVRMTQMLNETKMMEMRIMKTLQTLLKEEITIQKETMVTVTETKTPPETQESTTMQKTPSILDKETPQTIKESYPK